MTGGKFMYLFVVLVTLMSCQSLMGQDLVDQHLCRSQVDRFYHSLRKWEILDTLQTLTTDAQFVINADKTYVPYGGTFSGKTQIQNFFNLLFNKVVLISLKEGSALGFNNTYAVFVTENYKAKISVPGEGVAFQQESLDLFVFNENCMITKYVKFYDSYAAAKAMSDNMQSFTEPHLAPKFSGIEEDFAVDHAEAMVLVKAYYRLAATYPSKITQIMSKMATIVFPGNSQIIPFAGQWINRFEEIDDYILKRKALNITREPVAWNGVDTFIVSRSKAVFFWKETGINPKTKNMYTVHVAEIFEIVVSNKGVKIGRITEMLDSMPIYRVFREHRCHAAFHDYMEALHTDKSKNAGDFFSSKGVLHVPGEMKMGLTGRFSGKASISSYLERYNRRFDLSESYPHIKVKTDEFLVATVDQSVTSRLRGVRSYQKLASLMLVKFNKQCEIEYMGIYNNYHPSIKSINEQVATYSDPSPLKDIKVPFEADISEKAASDLIFEFYKRLQTGERVDILFAPDGVIYIPGDSSLVPYAGIFRGPRQIQNFAKAKKDSVVFARKPWSPVKGATMVAERGKVLVFWNETGTLQANYNYGYSQGILDMFTVTQTLDANNKPVLKIARLVQYGDTTPVVKAFEDNRPIVLSFSLWFFILLVVAIFVVAFLLAFLIGCCVGRSKNSNNSEKDGYMQVNNPSLTTNLVNSRDMNIIPGTHD